MGVTRRNGYCDLGNGSLYYEATGEGSPILFIQGFGLNLRYWDSFLPYMPANQLHICYDRRGYGQSSEPRQDVPYADFSDLAALLDHLGIDQVRIVSECVGGQVALEMAVEHPERVISLVMSNPDAVPGLAGANEAFFKLITDTRPFHASGEHRKALEVGFANPIIASSLRNDDVKFELTKAFAGYHGWHFLHWYPRQGSDPPLPGRLGDIAIPVLILSGGKDYVHFHRVATALQDKLPNATTQVIEDAGHYACVGYPEEAVRMIVDFHQTDFNQQA